ncbi:hypothetical protein ACJIZ3_004161 [Penstemon smallii]|uniref:Protein kinase domain-containing protein n=1 Tax=Penstemon smallii TaxID=265156 RepID=A0ABD3S1C4_9LAMI
MDQFRQVGEILGSLKALMVLKHDISINKVQCCLLYDMLELAFDTISDEIKQNLRLKERNTKWKVLELPMKELHRVFKEADLYIKQSLDIKDWWGKAISLHMNRNCIEFHIYDLLCCFTVVIEAIEAAAEISGIHEEQMQKKRIYLMKKYDEECKYDFDLFQWKFGKQYLVPRDICSRLDNAWKEDRWLLIQKIDEKKSKALGKNEQKLGDLLLKKLENMETKLPPSNILVGSQDYYVKRRLDSGGGHFKEIHWLGENFALRTFYGDIEPLNSEISLVLLLSHPNVMQYLCAFYDEERKEGFLVMELMSKDLGTYIKENSGQRKRIPFSIPVAVDIMLQIARGMEYLHSKKIYHGDLNPSNILLKARNATEGLFLAKVTGVGLTSIKNYTVRSPKPSGIDLDIWLAPEVLAELEQGSKCTAKYTEKADVYSFGMLCFELLTGKIPFEDGHLQGEKMVRNIRAGERPLFSYPSPKYLTNLTRKCWQTNPELRPTFSSICRILRCIKKNLVINPNHGHPDSPPPFVDYCDMEAGFLKKYSNEGNGNLGPISQIPFQIFAYRLVEKEKISGKNWDLSISDDEHLAAMDDLFLAPSDRRSVCSEIIDWKNPNTAVDMRSVVSEIPHRKLFSLDQRSFGSESPGKRFSTVAADQRSIGAETPERKRSLVEKKIDKKSTAQKQNAEVLEKAPKVAEHQPASTRPSPENNKSAITKGAEVKLENTEIIEKKLLPRAIVEHNHDSPKAITSHLPEIPEMKILKNTKSKEKMVSVSSRTSAKRVDSNNSVKKPMHINKLKEPMTTSSPKTSINDSPRSSPARIMKKSNTSLSPASSPARSIKTCASPKHISFSASKEYYSSSPVSSPLNPCARCTRLGRNSSLPSGMSPRRTTKTDHVSDSGSMVM